jgi:hypothetical protein
MDIKSAFPFSLTVNAYRSVDLPEIPYHSFIMQTLLSGTNSVDIIQVTAFEEKVKSRVSRGLPIPKTVLQRPPVLSLVWM